MNESENAMQSIVGASNVKLAGGILEGWGL